MENLEITINLPNFKLNVPEKQINFYYKWLTGSNKNAIIKDIRYLISYVFL